MRATASHKNSDSRVMAIEQKLQRQIVLWALKRALRDELLKPDYDVSTIAVEIPRAMRSLSLESKLRNLIYDVAQQSQAICGKGGDSLRGLPSGDRVDKSGELGTSSSLQAIELANSIAESSDITRAVDASHDAASSTRGVTWALGNVPFKIPEDDMLDVLLECRRRWDTQIAERMNAAARNGIPWVRVRVTSIDAAAGDLVHDSNCVSTDVQNSLERLPLSPCYEDADLLAALCSVRSGNHKGEAARFISWGQLGGLQLETPSLATLRCRFAELSPRHRHLGLDDELHSESEYAEQRLRLGQLVLSAGYVLELQQFAKNGVPPSLRSAIWSQILRLDSPTVQRSADLVQRDDTDAAPLPCKEERHFEALARQVDRWELMVDNMINECIRDILDDPNYFLFEDKIRLVLLCLTRDPQVFCLPNFSVCCQQLAGDCVSQPHRPLQIFPGQADHSARSEAETSPLPGVYPPGGLVPVRAWARWLAPLCYLTDHETELYYLYRAMFTRYFCRLHSIDDHQESILSLSKLFETLVEQFVPDVVYHLTQLGLPALDIAHHWIANMFVEYLPVKEVLLLWDRIVGFDSLQLLPVLAAAIFVFRSKELLATTSSLEIEELLEDFSALRVVPLLQSSLFTVPVTGN